MPIITALLGLRFGAWLADHTPDIGSPAWVERLLCRCLGHNWSRASLCQFPDPVYITRHWICFRCGERREELTQIAQDDAGRLTYAQWRELEKQKPH